jgi:uncharacterized membrane protein YhaH (DUF805 family)
MGFVASIKRCFSKYATFRGRAPRSEYWWFALFCLAGIIIADIADAIAGTYYHYPDGSRGEVGYIYVLWSLAILLPNVSVAVRRLHDRDRSGWWYWLVLVPVVGAIWLLVWFCRRGTSGPNRFGDDPLRAPPASAP